MRKRPKFSLCRAVWSLFAGRESAAFVDLFAVRVVCLKRIQVCVVASMSERIEKKTEMDPHTTSTSTIELCLGVTWSS